MAVINILWFLLVAIAVSLGHTNATSVFDLEGYTKTVLNSDANYSVAVKADTSHLHMVLAFTNQNWVGFGFAENGGHMKGADMVTVTRNSLTGITTVSDRYADFHSTSIAQGVVTYDGLTAAVDVHNDYEHIGTCEDGDTTYVAIKRPLVTGDTQDRDIVSGFRRAIWAWGDSAFVQHHGANRGSGLIDLVGGAVAPTIESDGFWDLRIPSYEIPSDKHTTYAELALELDTSITRHIVGLEVLVDEELKGMVHHVTMSAYRTKTNFVQSIWNKMVSNKETSGCAHPCSRGQDELGVFFAWAVGMQPFVLPPEAGFRVSDSPDDVRYVMIQVHYDNPTYKKGMKDDTIIRVHYSNTLRTHDAWLIMLGDPHLNFGNGGSSNVPGNEYGSLPPKTENIRRTGTCPGSCTKYMAHDIKLFASFLHMHYFGQKIYTDLYDVDGSFIRTTNRIDFWDNGFQSGTPIDIDFKPGQSLQVHCHFNTKTQASGVEFGESTSEEMCIDFTFYYPRQKNFTHCGYHSDGTLCTAAPHTVKLDHSTQSSLQDGGYPDPLAFGTASGKTAPSVEAIDHQTCPFSGNGVRLPLGEVMALVACITLVVIMEA